MVLRDCLINRQRTAAKPLTQSRGHGQAGPLLVVDRDANQMLAVPKALHDTGQLSRGAFFQGTLHVAGQAFAQYLSAPFKIATETGFFELDFVVRKRQGHQRDAHNQRNDQARTDESQRYSWLEDTVRPTGTSASHVPNTPNNPITRI